MAMIEGEKGCGGCHKIGDNTLTEVLELRQNGSGTEFGAAQCDACHTRHTFSAEEARSPQACETCHMQDGNHEVRTAWGFLAVRLAQAQDKTWAADRATILEALGVLDPQGQPTKLVDVVKAADLARLSQEDWQRERDQMVKTCNQCHSVNFAKQQLEQGDDMIKNPIT
jgi:hydroxylamine dehydrogenase